MKQLGILGQNIAVDIFVAVHCLFIFCVNGAHCLATHGPYIYASFAVHVLFIYYLKVFHIRSFMNLSA